MGYNVITQYRHEDRDEIIKRLQLKIWRRRARAGEDTKTHTHAGAYALNYSRMKGSKR